MVLKSIFAIIILVLRKGLELNFSIRIVWELVYA